MKCKHCGAEIANDSKFCEFCGKKQKRHRQAFWIILITLLLLLFVAAIGAIGMDYYLNYFNYVDTTEECVDTTSIQAEESTTAEPAEVMIIQENEGVKNQQTVSGVMSEQPIRLRTEKATSDGDDNRVYSVDEVDQAPHFPGGEDSLQSFIKENIVYTTFVNEDPSSRGLGTVYVSYIVEKDGGISNAKIINDIGGGAGETALRLVSIMPHWYPGYKGGKAVRTQYELPVNFEKRLTITTEIRYKTTRTRIR